jgi:hypothetical protein
MCFHDKGTPCSGSHLKDFVCDTQDLGVGDKADLGRGDDVERALKKKTGLKFELTNKEWGAEKGN